MGRLKVTQTRGKVGTLQQHRDTLRTLGLKRINDVVVGRTARDPWHGPCGGPPGHR